ncbi:MAG: hypothetical protein ABIN36_08220 [Ferruginibacter sp.]
MKPIQTLLIAELSKPVKAIILETPFQLSGRYDIYIDGRQEAMVTQIMLSPQWRVSPREGGWLTQKDCDTLLRTILNLENPNFKFS